MPIPGVPLHVNKTWLKDAVENQDPLSLVNPPPSTTGIDMTWVIEHQVLYVCLACVIFSCCVSFRAVWKHVNDYEYPKLQIHVVRILLMIPFYGILTITGLFFPKYRFFLDTIRDTYESFVLYTFFMLLVQYCGGEPQLLRSLRAKRYKGVHPFPLCCIKMYPLDQAFYLRCKRWVLQYALIKPLVTLIACIGDPLGLYNEAEFEPTGIYMYTYTIMNCSISMSLYYLVVFHLETERELHYCRPAWKFVCIKSIIFFAFWQTATISACIAIGWVYTGEGELREEVNSAIGDVLMCIELVPVSLMHDLAFGRSKLEEEMTEEPPHNLDEGGLYASKSNQPSAKSNLEQVFHLGDFVRDTVMTIFYHKDHLVGADDDDDEEEHGRAGGVAIGDTADDGGPATGAPMSGVAVGAGATGKTFANGLTVTEDDLRFLATMQAEEDEALRIGWYGGGWGANSSNLPALADNAVENQEIQDEGDVWLDPKGMAAAKRRKDKKNGSNGGGGAGSSSLGADNYGVEEGDDARPAVFCTVCGRYDRKMVQRKSGYKCVECVGSASKATLKKQQEEAYAGEADACVICGRKDRVMVKKGQKLRCIQCLPK